MRSYLGVSLFLVMCSLSSIVLANSTASPLTSPARKPNPVVERWILFFINSRIDLKKLPYRRYDQC